MTLEIPKQEWSRFFDDLSKRRSEWLTKIEVMNDSIGSQILSEGLPLAGITAEQRGGGDGDGGENVIEIAVGKETDQHQTHNVINPTKVAYLSEDDAPGGIVEFEEENGTKTLVHIIRPMPIIVGYSEFEVVSTAV